MIRLGVFLKLPVPGKAKTRLAQSIGPERAAFEYERMVEHVLKHAVEPVRSSLAVTLWGDPFEPREEYDRKWGDRGFEIALQQGPDLGLRMRHALGEAPGMVIGTDCLRLLPRHLLEAKQALEAGKDLVLGPATDGGYYLIGTRVAHGSLFEGIQWSTSTVLEATLKRAHELDLKVHLLEKLSDIDTWDDLLASPLYVREATPEDARAIGVIHVDTWRTTYQGIVPQDFLDKLSYDDRTAMWKAALSANRPQHHCLVVEDAADGVIGFVSGGPNRSEPEDIDAEIYALYLLKRHHGRDHGRALFRGALLRLKEEGFKRAILWVLERNPTTGFYEKMGGRRIAEKMEPIGGRSFKEIGYAWDL